MFHFSSLSVKSANSYALPIEIHSKVSVVTSWIVMIPEPVLLHTALINTLWFLQELVEVQTYLTISVKKLTETSVDKLLEFLCILTAALIADLFQFCKVLIKIHKIQSFNNTWLYLDDTFNIYNPSFHTLFNGCLST